jgi:hypothetical protein
MFTGDVVVWADPDGKHYVGCVEDGSYWRWPAEAHGWRSRTRSSAEYAEGCVEMEAPFSGLAVRLSGVE